MALKYIGGGAWLPGIPARDLTDEEVKQFPAAKDSPIYEQGSKSKPLPQGEVLPESDEE